MHAWEITNWTQTPILHDDMPPFPDELVAGIAAEGRVHFVTTLSDSELNLSWVRFFVETTMAGGTAEIKADINVSGRHAPTSGSTVIPHFLNSDSGM